MKSEYWLVVIALVGAFGSYTQFINSPPDVTTIIAPHHDVVASERADLFEKLSKRQTIDRFILLSPDHYNLAAGTVLIHDKEFTTRFGNVNLDAETRVIAEEISAKTSLGTFQSEHGIRTILPDIARFFPEASVIPIVVKPDIDEADLSRLLTTLRQSCADCVMIASVDMSHYQPYALSELHDELTLRAIYNRDSELISQNAEVGPPHILRAAIKWAELTGARRFEQQFHTNSTEISGDYYEEGTTHIAGWYVQDDPKGAAEGVTFTFVGDVMFDRGVGRHIELAGSDVLLSKLGDRTLWGTDLVLANLEGPFTTAPTLPIGANNAPRFSFKPSSAGQLGFLHINAVNLLNNHVDDAGKAGVDSTDDILKANDIASLSDDSPLLIEGEDLTMVIFGVDITASQELNESALAPYTNDEEYRIVIYPHWGPENESTPSQHQRNLAQSWIDLGADLVVGTGPHVIQTGEVYKGKPIIYSLGNFIFDMQGNDAQSLGLIISGSFNSKGVRLVISIADSRKLFPILGRSEIYDQIIRDHLPDLEPNIVDQRGGLTYSFTQ